MGDKEDLDVVEQVGRVVAMHLPAARPLMPLPWETPFFASPDAGSSFLPDIPTAWSMPRQVEPAVENVGQSSLGVRVVEPWKRPRPKSWREHLDDSRQVALHAWMALISGYESHWEVGRQLGLAADREARMTILSDALAEKATSTLRSRASALNGFWVWCKSRGVEPSPLVEATVYEYCKYCQAEGSPPTKVSSLRSGIVFASHILGWVVQKSLLDSRRISGVAFTELQRLPPVRRREALEPSFLLFLARLVCSDDCQMEARLVAGFFLFMTPTRARFADAMSVHGEPWLTNKGRWIEAVVKNYKTSKARNRRGKELPLVAPTKLRTYGWAQEWLAVRESMACVAGNGEALLPLFVEGTKTTAAWSNAEANEALRELLQRAKAEDAVSPGCVVEAHGTHSCKRTTLHWASAAGLSLDDRRLLGHHVIKADGSWMAYARDALSPLLSKYEDIVNRVMLYLGLIT